MVEAKRGHARRAPARCWRSSSPRAATRPRSSSARGSAQISDSGELEASVDARDRGQPRGRGAGARRQPEGDRPDRRRGDAGDEGPRRRGRGDEADPREARRRAVRLYGLDGLERRDRRWRVRGGPRGARARARDAAPVGAARARQRRQLPALHAVPARGGGGDARAAPRRHPAARHAAAHLPAPRGGDRHDPAARTVEITTHEGETEEHALRPARARARLGVAAAAGPGPRRARDRVQEPRRRDLAAKPRHRDARGRERERGRRRAAASC